MRKLFRKKSKINNKNITDEGWKQSNKMIQNLRTNFSEDFVLEIKFNEHNKSWITISAVKL